jgi:DNA-binding transcriptional LysR family regulator
LEIQAISYFNELVRAGSIRQAAEMLNVSPTAVVRQLDKLEHALGATLVERNPRGIKLTAAGEVLAAKAMQVARELTSARQIIDDLRGLRRGSVQVQVNGAASSAILAPALVDFSRRYPGISITVTATSAQGALNAVTEGLSDVAVTMFSPPEPQIEVRFRSPVRHEIIVSPGHPLASLAEITLPALLAHPLALPDRSYGVRLAFEARLRQAGLQLGEVAFTTTSLELQKELARQCAAALLLPEMTVAREIRAGNLVMRPLAASCRIETQLQLSRARNREQSFAANCLSDFLERFLRSTLGN